MKFVDGEIYDFCYDGVILSARCLGFCINKYLFQNLETADFHGHFAWTQEEAEEKMTMLLF